MLLTLALTLKNFLTAAAEVQNTKLMQQFNLEKETITLTHPTYAETERLKNTHYCYASTADCSTVVFKRILPTSFTKKDSQKPFLSTFALPIIATTAITASILFKYLKKSKE